MASIFHSLSTGLTSNAIMVLGIAAKKSLNKIQTTIDKIKVHSQQQ
jgi:hypothetical protein